VEGTCSELKQLPRGKTLKKGGESYKGRELSKEEKLKLLPKVKKVKMQMDE